VATLQRGIGIATLVACALIAVGCSTPDVRDRQAMQDIQFGIWSPDAEGAMRFVATADVPNVEDQAYGWRVRVAESERALKWIETVTLPQPPESWGDMEDDPNVVISDDGRTATTVGAVIPDGGYLEGTWYVAIDDPAGEYVMSVELSDGRHASFMFRLNEPAATQRGTVTGT
jgi:hypothetical protein